jgi:hypothetical protein
MPTTLFYPRVCPLGDWGQESENNTSTDSGLPGPIIRSRLLPPHPYPLVGTKQAFNKIVAKFDTLANTLQRSSSGSGGSKPTKVESDDFDDLTVSAKYWC